MSEQASIRRLDGRGLDFNNLAGITAEEVEAFRASYRTEDGSQQSGFEFLIDHNPAALKTYRYFATQVQPPFREARYQAVVFGGIAWVAHLNFDEGVRYCVFPAMRAGFTKAEIEEGLALSFMAGGTRALVTIDRALKDFNWPEATSDPIVWPEGWVSDPAAFESGVDFSTSDVLPGETELIVGWYEENIDWVPTWVRFFARYNPGALKGWRYRYEKALVTLPKQVLPLSLLFAAARFEQEDSIRENMLLARTFGAAFADVIQAIGVTAVYGTEKVSVAYKVAGDILDGWHESESDAA